MRRLWPGSHHFACPAISWTLHYRLTRQQLESFGGEASVSGQLSAEAKLLTADHSGEYVLERDFKTPMRVLFLPEEIRAALAVRQDYEKPRLGLVPVKEPLDWEDAPETLAGLRQP